MSRIRGKNTKPELAVRSLLHRLGYRFTVNGPKNKKLPGRPDIALPKWRTLVFVHGCFWHGHENCKGFRLPKTRTEWWRAKIAKNKARDRANAQKLGTAGWNVLIIWACQLKNRDRLADLAEKFPDLIERPEPALISLPRQLPRVAEDERPYGVQEN